MCLESNMSMAEIPVVEAVFQKPLECSSEELPMDEWSSLILENNIPRLNIPLCNDELGEPRSGDICGKYISTSDSSVLRHVYYKYPSVKDPGISVALLEAEPKKIYSYDGQELYLHLCLEMNVTPVRAFHKGLVNEVIDLRYYCVNPVGVRAMCLALVNNQHVKRLDLTSNHLSRDAWYHLGQLLGDSFALQELVLAGCKLGPEGLKLLVSRLSEQTLEVLDLSKNAIGDDGFQYLANQIMKGAVIKRLNLSYNHLSNASGIALAEALSHNNSITHLDISWNSMHIPKGSNELLEVLGESKVLTELNFSWNALATDQFLQNVVSLKTLQVLDLSNNRLSTRAVQEISSTLRRAKNLHTLNLSHNPLTPADALTMLTKMKDDRVYLQNLYMEDVPVTKEFVVTLKEVLSLKHRSNTTITYGRVLRDYVLPSEDLREIVMKRLDYLTARASKKCNVDVGVFFLQAHKTTGPVIKVRDLARDLNSVSAPINDDLLSQLADCFPASKSDKGEKTINLTAVVDYVYRLWPDKKLPPTSPPEPEPVVVILKKNKLRGKKKK